MDRSVTQHDMNVLYSSSLIQLLPFESLSIVPAGTDRLFLSPTPALKCWATLIASVAGRGPFLSKYLPAAAGV